MGTPLPAAPAFRINSTASFSEGRSVATLKDGTFVVTWIDTVDIEIEEGVFQQQSWIRGQVFYANGDKLGGELVISSPKPGESSFFRDVQVAALKDGGFAVSYSHTPDGGVENDDIWLRVYEADRSAGAEFVATQAADGWQGYPALTALSDGGFTLSYLHSESQIPGQQLRFQRYDSNGTRTGTNTLVSSTGDLQSMTTLKNGNVVIAYEDYIGEELRAHIYTPDGAEVSPSGGVILPSTRDGLQGQPSITALADGRFAAVWTQRSPTAEDPSGLSLRGRIFNADGTATGNDFQVNVKTDDAQRKASVAALPNGGFAVAFQDVTFGSSTAESIYSIRVVAFGADGQRDGEEIVVATGGAYDVEAPSLSALADGRLLLTWTELNQYRDPYSAAQVLDPRVESIDWAGSNDEDNYVGTDFDDALSGLAGHDRLYGSKGADTIDGGAGADSLDGGAGFDMASYAKAASRVSVSLSDKSGTVGEAAGDTLSSIEGVVGSNFDDALVGDDFANLLKGGRGKDNMQGGSGDDTLWGGSANDVLKGNAGQDTFVFDAKANTKTNKDKIVDFKAKDDSFWLDNAVFSKLGKKGTEGQPAQLKKAFFVVGSAAKDKNDYVIYDKKKGVLSYDADGSGTKYKAVEIASLSKNLSLTYKDFFVI